MTDSTDLRRARRNGSPETYASIDRPPPSSIEAEAAVLGCILLAPYDCIYECITKFVDGPVVFYDLRHQVIYSTMVEMSDAMDLIDIITMQQRLKDKQQLEAVGGIAYLAALPDTTPSAANLSFYVGIVLEKHALRKLLRVCTEIAASVYEFDGEDVEALLDKSETEFLRATQRQTSRIAVQCGPAVLRAITNIERYSLQDGSIAGLSTGLIDLDKMTNGFRPGNMIIIAARPSVGKSSLAMNIAEAVAVDQKLPVGLFSLEMTEDELIERALLSRARVNIRNVREGFISERDYPKITLSATRFSVAPIYIDDSSGLSIMELRARARRMAQMYGIKIFIIDYIQLLHSTARKAQTRQQEIGDISRGCKSLAKDLNVPVVVLAQLNRDIEKDKNRKPRLSDLREAGDLEQDADIVGMLYKPKTGDDDDSGWEREAVPVNLLIAKQRSGPTGDIPLVFLPAYTRFQSAARISADDIPPEGNMI